MLSKDTILASSDLPMELGDVPDWVGELYVRTLNGTERDAFDLSMVGKKISTNL